MQLESYDDFFYTVQLKVYQICSGDSRPKSDKIEKNQLMPLSIYEILAYYLFSSVLSHDFNGLKGPLLQMTDKKTDGRVSYKEFEEFLND